jgi:hypothetical protein
MIDALIQTYIAPVVLWFVGLLTPKEWLALLWLVLGTFMFVHFAKLAWRLLPIPGGGNHDAIHVLAGVIGAILAYSLWPETSAAPWWIVGPTAGGGGAIGVFKAFFPVLSMISPRLARAFNGDRRKLELGPPPATPGRRKDDQTP